MKRQPEARTNLAGRRTIQRALADDLRFRGLTPQSCRPDHRRYASLLGEAIGWWQANSYDGWSQYLEDLSGNGLRMRLGSSGPTTFITQSGGGVPCFAKTDTNGAIRAASDTTIGLHPTTELDVRVVCALADWTPAASAPLISKATTGKLEWQLSLNSGSTGQLVAFLSTDGTTWGTQSAATVIPTVADGAILAVRWTWRKSDGRMQFFTKATSEATAKADAQSNSGWVQLGADRTGTTSAVFPSVMPITLGADAGQVSAQIGSWFYADVRHAINGSPVATFDPSVNLGAAGWLDPQGNRWKLYPDGADTNDPLWLPYTGTPYAYFPGVAGNNATIPDGASLDLTAQADFRCAVALADWTPSTTVTLISKADSGDLAYQFSVAVGGYLNILVTSQAGAWDTNVQSSAIVPVADGALACIRATWRNSDGRYQFFYKATTEAAAKADCQSNSGWTQVGTDGTGTTNAIRNGGRVLSFGSAVNSAANMMTGPMYYAEVRSSIDGAVVASFDPSLAVSPFASWTTAEGLTVTVNRSASGRKAQIVDRAQFLLGLDDFMQVDDHPYINFAAGQDFTVAIAYRRFGSDSAYQHLVSKMSAGSIGWCIEQSSGGNQARLLAGDGTLSAASATTPTAGVAVMAAGGRDNSQAVGSRLFNYMAGTLNRGGGGTPPAASLSNSLAMRIGSAAIDNYGAALEFFNAAIFRRALSAAELATLAAYWGCS